MNPLSIRPNLPQTLINDNLWYSEGEGVNEILFNNVKNLGTPVLSPPLGIENSYINGDDLDIKKITRIRFKSLNVVDLDWNEAIVEEKEVDGELLVVSLSTTGDLLRWIKSSDAKKVNISDILGNNSWPLDNELNPIPLLDYINLKEGVLPTFVALSGSDIATVGTPSVTIDDTESGVVKFVFHQLKGATGAKGSKGATGAAGAKGSDGISITSASINSADGHLTLTKSDGTSIDVGKVVGENGINGTTPVITGLLTTTSSTDGGTNEFTFYSNGSSIGSISVKNGSKGSDGQGGGGTGIADSIQLLDGTDKIYFDDRDSWQNDWNNFDTNTYILNPSTGVIGKILLNNSNEKTLVNILPNTRIKYGLNLYINLSSDGGIPTFDLNKRLVPTNLSYNGTDTFALVTKLASGSPVGIYTSFEVIRELPEFMDYNDPNTYIIRDYKDHTTGTRKATWMINYGPGTLGSPGQLLTGSSGSANSTWTAAPTESGLLLVSLGISSSPIWRTKSLLGLVTTGDLSTAVNNAVNSAISSSTSIVKSVSINNGTVQTPDANGNVDLTISNSGESSDSGASSLSSGVYFFSNRGEFDEIYDSSKTYLALAIIDKATNLKFLVDLDFISYNSQQQKYVFKQDVIGFTNVACANVKPLSATNGLDNTIRLCLGDNSNSIFLIAQRSTKVVWKPDPTGEGYIQDYTLEGYIPSYLELQVILKYYTEILKAHDSIYYTQQMAAQSIQSAYNEWGNADTIFFITSTLSNENNAGSLICSSRRTSYNPVTGMDTASMNYFTCYPLA